MTVRARTTLVEELVWHIARVRVVLIVNVIGSGLETLWLLHRRQQFLAWSAAGVTGMAAASTVLFTRLLRAMRARA